MNVVNLGQPNLRDVIESLRLLADKMETGEVEASSHAIVVSESPDGNVELYGYGDIGDIKSEIGLLQIAIIKMATGG